MNTAVFLRTAWDWEPSILAGCAALLLLYGWAIGWRFSRAASSYIAGVALIFLALSSPLDTLGDHYLFSAHMLQHLLLALIIPPLLIVGIPAAVAKRALAIPPVNTAERILSTPGVAWTAGIGAMALWHMPPLFNAALESQSLHIVQHLCFLVTGTIFWWPVLKPIESRLAPVPASVAYLFTACLACTILGIMITFSPPGIYPAYLNPVGEPGILSLVRDQWQITASADHQTGGLLMWVLGCTVYLCATMAMFARWYSTSSSTSEVR